MDGGAPGRGMDAPRPSPYLALGISFICSWVKSCYNKPLASKYSISEFWEPLKQINWTQGGGPGKLWFIAGQSEAVVTTWTHDWSLKWGQGAGLVGLNPPPEEPDAISGRRCCLRIACWCRGPHTRGNWSEKPIYGARTLLPKAPSQIYLYWLWTMFSLP